jgi:hypothetical protein
MTSHNLSIPYNIGDIIIHKYKLILITDIKQYIHKKLNKKYKCISIYGLSDGTIKLIFSSDISNLGKFNFFITEHIKNSSVHS